MKARTKKAIAVSSPSTDSNIITTVEPMVEATVSIETVEATVQPMDAKDIEVAALLAKLAELGYSVPVAKVAAPRLPRECVYGATVKERAAELARSGIGASDMRKALLKEGHDVTNQWCYHQLRNALKATVGGDRLPVGNRRLNSDGTVIEIQRTVKERAASRTSRTGAREAYAKLNAPVEPTMPEIQSQNFRYVLDGTKYRIFHGTSEVPVFTLNANKGVSEDALKAAITQADAFMAKSVEELAEIRDNGGEFDAITRIAARAACVVLQSA